MSESNEKEHLVCFMSFTFSSFLLGLGHVIQSKTYQANPTIPTTTTALTFIFKAHVTTAIHNAAPRISAFIACLCCITFVDGFLVAALPYPLPRHGFISAEGRLSEAFGCCSFEAF